MFGKMLVMDEKPDAVSEYSRLPLMKTPAPVESDRRSAESLAGFVGALLGLECTSSEERRVSCFWVMARPASGRDQSFRWLKDERVADTKDEQDRGSEQSHEAISSKWQDTSYSWRWKCLS